MPWLRWMRLRLSAALLASVALVSVSAADDPHYSQYRRLELGRSAGIPEAGIALRFVEVVQDQRCPPGVTCVTSGPAIVRLEVTRDSGEPGRAEVTLGTNHRSALLDGMIGIELHFVSDRTSLVPYYIELRIFKASIVKFEASG